MFPRWLNWLFLVAIAYLVYTGQRASHSVNTAVTSSPAPAHEYRALEQFMNPNRWQRAVNPAYVGTEKTVDLTPGTGAVAQCGDEVTLRVTGLPQSQQTPAEARILHVTLGDAPYPVLNYSVPGMREGGVRQVTAPRALLTPDATPPSGSLAEDVPLHVTLEKVAATDTPEQRSVPHFGNRIVIDQEGAGEVTRCGDAMQVLLRLWDNHGRASYTTPAPVTLTPGQSSLPPALTRGLASMRLHEVRSLVIADDAATALEASPLPAPVFAALKRGTLVLLTVERVPASEAAAPQ